jgi:hypothetical protein
VHENVGSAAIRGNETETLCFIKKLNLAARHSIHLQFIARNSSVSGVEG